MPSRAAPPAKKSAPKAPAKSSRAVRVRKDGQPDGRTKNVGTKGNKGGRPRWEPKPKMIEVRPGTYRDQTAEEAMEDARALVRHYVAIGYPCEVIAKLMQPPCEETTIRRHFAWELENGKLVQNARVAGTAYALASSGRDPGMTRFWLRTQMGWSERNPGEGQGAIVIQSIPGDEGL